MTKLEMIQEYEALSKKAFKTYNELFRLGYKNISFPKSVYARPSYTKAKIQECINMIQSECDRLTDALSDHYWEEAERAFDPTYAMMMDND